jgi:hypothetical protein
MGALTEDSEPDDDRQVTPLPREMLGPPDRDMCIDPSKLTYISLLGRGAFGEVHYGTWEAPDGQVHDVAIKVLLATRYGSLQECEKVRAAQSPAHAAPPLRMLCYLQALVCRATRKLHPVGRAL